MAITIHLFFRFLLWYMIQILSPNLCHWQTFHNASEFHEILGNEKPRVHLILVSKWYTSRPVGKKTRAQSMWVLIQYFTSLKNHSACIKKGILPSGYVFAKLFCLLHWMYLVKFAFLATLFKYCFRAGQVTCIFIALFIFDCKVNGVFASTYLLLFRLPIGTHSRKKKLAGVLYSWSWDQLFCNYISWNVLLSSSWIMSNSSSKVGMPWYASVNVFIRLGLWWKPEVLPGWM